MIKNKGFYIVDIYDSLRSGLELAIGHSISRIHGKADISELTPLPLAELERRRAESAGQEQAIFEELCAAVSKWEEQAAVTMMLDLAKEYIQTSAVDHTANQWQDKNGGKHISNMVYRMNYNVYEETSYNRETKTSEPVAWHVSWSVYTNAPRQNHAWSSNFKKIAGQNRKRFTDKAAMEKYLNGRIAAYAGLFKEISPPIPQEYANYFTVNGMLLPGYTIADEKPAKMSEEQANIYEQSESGHTSVLAAIEKDRADKQTKAADKDGSRDNPAQEKSKSRRKKDGEEL